MKRPAALILLCCLLAGCQPAASVPAPHPQAAESSAFNYVATSGKPSADEAVLSDPCAARLHDIAGAILMYYALNKRLPDRLEQVQSMADIDMQLDFTCPLSHKPYGYTPAGLLAAGNSKRIIVYDPEPSHNGKRWCIEMTMQSQANAAQTVDVIEIPEAAFKAYLPTGN